MSWQKKVQPFLVAFGLFALFIGIFYAFSVGEEDTKARIPNNTYIESQDKYTRFTASILVDKKTKTRFLVVDYGEGVAISPIPTNSGENK